MSLGNEFQAKILFILHRGFVEARLLALAEKCEQLFDLADAMEVLPELLLQPQDENVERVREILTRYQEKYSNQCFDYLSYLE
jgi:hypothetical protein